jgi:hypothetical protein
MMNHRTRDRRLIDNIVEFRAGDTLFPEIQVRDEGHGIGQTARRDLERYYYMIRSQTPKFSEPEARLLLDALSGIITEPHTARLLWAVVDDAIRLGRLDEKWRVDGRALVQRLRYDLCPFEALAVTDAVERVWNLMNDAKSGPVTDALLRVGLLREEE